MATKDAAIGRELDALAREARAEAIRARLLVDRPVYEQAGRDPRGPILWAGNPRARVCCFGRDLGRDEVRHGQPLVGASGRKVRRGLLEAAGRSPSRDDALLEEALDHALLTNAVPYKPPDNRAYPPQIVERFRPLLERLLGCVWSGEVVLALGDGAFRWFEPYFDPPVARRPFELECGEGAARSCRLLLACGGRRAVRTFVVCALPHPSPANARWAKQFPALLARQLERWRRAT